MSKRTKKPEIEGHEQLLEWAPETSKIATVKGEMEYGSWCEKMVSEINSAPGRSCGVFRKRYGSRIMASVWEKSSRAKKEDEKGDK